MSKLIISPQNCKNEIRCDLERIRISTTITRGWGGVDAGFLKGGFNLGLHAKKGGSGFGLHVEKPTSLGKRGGPDPRTAPGSAPARNCGRFHEKNNIINSFSVTVNNTNSLAAFWRCEMTDKTKSIMLCIIFDRRSLGHCWVSIHIQMINTKMS